MGMEARYSAEETARRGDAIYEQSIRAQVESRHGGKVVAIDVETGAYAVGETAVAAARGLRADHPRAEIWFVRVGDRALRRMGVRRPVERT